MLRFAALALLLAPAALAQTFESIEIPEQFDFWDYSTADDVSADGTKITGFLGSSGSGDAYWMSVGDEVVPDTLIRLRDSRNSYPREMSAGGFHVITSRCQSGTFSSGNISDCWTDHSAPIVETVVVDETLDPSDFFFLRHEQTEIAARTFLNPFEAQIPEGDGPPDAFFGIGASINADGTRVDGSLGGFWDGADDNLSAVDAVRWMIDAEPMPDGTFGFSLSGFQPGAWPVFDNDADPQPDVQIDGYTIYDGSDDGSVLVGADVYGDGAGGGVRVENGAVQPVAFPEGGGRPIAVSGDGSVMAGTMNFRRQWFRAVGTAVQPIPPLNEFPNFAAPLRLSADGSVMVGYEQRNSAPEPFRALIWTEDTGLMLMTEYLVQNGVDPSDLAGWRLTFAAGVSDNGTTIVGRGVDPDGNVRGWVARLGSDGLVVNTTSDQSNNSQSQSERVCDVNRSLDGNQCTLRAAIEVANARAEDDGNGATVGFDVDGPIQVTSALLALGDGVRLRAPVEEGEPRAVRVDGGGGDYDGLVAEGEGSGVVGLSVTGFGGAAVVLRGDGATLEDAWIGLDADGGPAGNAVGVRVEGPNAVLARSVLSGNTVLNAAEPTSVAELEGVGLWLAEGTEDVTFDEVLVGTTPDASGPAGNAVGVLIDGLDDFVLTLDDDITIAGNAPPQSLPPAEDGVATLRELYGTGIAVLGADGVRLQDLRTGLVETDDAFVAIPNQRGVAVWGSDDVVLDGGVVLGVSHGIWIDALPSQSPSRDARVTRATVGILPDGTLPGDAAAPGTGIAVRRAAGTRLGEPGGRNVVAGWGTGIHIYGAPDQAASGTRVVGSFIGTDEVGVSIPTDRGIWVEGAAAFTQIGGWESDNEGNVIDGGYAIAVTGDATAEPNSVLIGGNLIGLAGDGVTRLEPDVGVFVGPTGVLRGDPDAEGGAAGVRVGLIASEAGGASAERRRNIIASASEANVVVMRNGAQPENAGPVLVLNNWIGLDAAGQGGLTASTLDGATEVGVHVRGTARAVVGGAGAGNVISGHQIGVLAEADETVVGWNRIGTDPEGLERRANFIGVGVAGSRVTVGQQDGAPAPNVISGNELPGAERDDDVLDGVGVLVARRDAFEAVLSGARRPAASPEGARGMVHPAAGFLPNALGPDALRTGGDAPPEDNVIADNWIGLTADGDAAVVPTDEINDATGILVSLGATRTRIVGNVIGGQEAAIVLNQRIAEGLPFLLPTGTAIARNRMGLSALSDEPVPNRAVGIGVFFSLDAVIGEGAVEGEGPNQIAFSGAEGSGLPPGTFGAPGVFMLHPEVSDIDVPTGRHRLTRNLIWGNQGLGITYDGESFGPGTDLEDVDELGARFDAPFLYQVVGDGAGLAVQGQAAGPGTVEVFSNFTCDASGYGEARRFLGALDVPGPGLFTAAVAGAGPTVRVSATFTNANGTTSDLARCQAVSGPGGAASLAVGDGETPTLDGPDLSVTVTDNPTGAPVAAKRTDGLAPSKRVAPRRLPTDGARASGTLYASRHDWTADPGPEDGAFDGSATSDDGTTVTPNDVQRQRFWSVRTASLDGIAVRACLGYGELFSLPAPGQIVVVTRPHRGEPWVPHDTDLATLGGDPFACADGLDASGELALGVDGTVNPVSSEDGPGETSPDAVPDELALTVYPNPSRGRATVSVALPDAADVTVAVVDALGRSVARVPLGRLAAGVHDARLPDGLAPGVYVVLVRTADGVVTRRLTVAR